MQRMCPILERDTAVEVTEFCRDSWQIVRRQETGFVYLADPPKYELLEEELAWEKTSVKEDQRRRLEEPMYSRVSSLSKRVKTLLFPRRNKFYALLRSLANRKPQANGLTVLDVGCGTGDLLEDICERFEQLNQRIVPWGIEISKNLAAAAEAKFSRLGGHVVSASAIDGMTQLEEDSLDVVLMSSFLEHEARPLSLLKQIRIALRPGGAIVIKVPNFSCWNRRIRGRRWCGFRYPDHVNYFTPRTLAMLADEAGLPIARQNWLDKLPSSDNMYAVLKKRA